MSLFQDEKISQEEFDKQHNLNQPDFATRLGFDEILNERQKIRQENIEQENQWVKNIVSPDKVNEWKKQGAMTAIDVWNKKEGQELVPFMGTWKQGTKSFDVKRISDKMQKGDVITPQEREKFEKFVLDLAEVQTRGYTFLGGTTNLGLETIPFMVEFGLGLLTSGGTSSIGATSSKLSTEVLKKGLTEQIAKGVAKTAYNATLNPRTYAFTATRLPQQVRARMGDIMLSDSIAISPEGQAILTESKEKPAIAFMKALALTNIETASEISGEMLVRPVLQSGAKLGKVVASPIMKMLPEGFADEFVKLAEKVTKLPFAKAVDDLGFNGILEEMGEERVGDLLTVALNLDGKDGYSFEQLLDALFPNVSQGVGEFAKELAQEALSFSAAGAAMNTLHHGIKAIPKVGDKYTKDGFLIDAGIFRVAGYDSYLDGKVREELTKRGKNEDEIDNAINFSSRDDKIQFLKDAKTQFDSNKEYDAKEFEKDLKRAEIEDKAYNKFMQGGLSQDQAVANAKLFGQFFKKYGSGNIKAFDKWFDKFDVQYNIPAKNNKTFFQSAMLAGINPKQKVNVVDLSSQFDTDKNLTKTDLTNYIKTLIGTKPLTSKDKKALFSFVGRSKRVGKPNVYIPAHIAGSSKVENTYKGERNTAVNNIVKLIQNSTLIDVSENKDKTGKPNVDNYLRFYTPVKIGNDIYTIRITAENNKNKDVFNILNADVYDVIIDKKMTTSSTLKNNSSNSLMKSSNNSINENAQDFNPDELTIEEMLKDVVDSEGKTYFQSAYHGTPHRFDKFSTDNIGTGEGAQAHGWGLYFAENKDVSEDYRRKLSGHKVFYKGQEIEQPYVYTNRWMKGQDVEQNKYLSNLRSVIDDISEIYASKKISLEEAKQEFIKEYKSKKKLLSFQKKYLEIAKDIDTSKIDIQKGQLFEVDIPENDELLDEEEPFSTQTENVKNSIKALIKDLLGIKSFADKDLDEEIKKTEKEKEENYNYIVSRKLELLKDLRFDDTVGKDFYNHLAEYLRVSENITNPQHKKEASLLLNKYGVKGITYDGRQDGRCYVIFDDKAIDVLKTYYQLEDAPLTDPLPQGAREQNNTDDEILIAGYTTPQVLDKLTELNDKIYKNEKISAKEKDNIIAKIHILEDAMDVAGSPYKYTNDKQRQDIMLNAYFVMNNQEIPQDYIETDSKSQRTYKDLKDIHDRKKQERENKYYGYFTEGQNKNIITIMSNHNSSTALHELGHLFLNGLNELAKVDDNAKKQLEAVNKWLGFSGEYTVKQQEKFARSFEAYLYKGKAPNNTLKSVFENFKEWLKSVYESITELENKGADISDEVQELFDNMFGSDEYYQERKLANELLERVKNISKKQKVEKIPVRNDKELDKLAKRHKNVCYEILSVATGKSEKWLKTIFETDSGRKSFGKKRENIQELLDLTNDRINTTGGMRPHWREFFSDTGVSYDTEEVNGDEELARQALDVIINKSYGVIDANNELDNQAKYFEKAIDDADRQYKILLNEYKNGNKNIALSAVYEWIEQLDKEIRQDYEDRFIYDSGVIEREENVDKFDKAKRQILSKALELENRYSINENENYQELVKQTMKSLDFLSPDDKAKITANILDLPSTDFLMHSLDEIMDIAKTMEDINLRRNLEREIHKELQGTKNIRKNGRTVGKYNYKTNKIFEELRELDKLSPEKANDLRLELQKFVSAEDNGLSYKDKLCNKFLSYKAGGRTFADTELMKELYDEIIKIKLIGKSAKSELELTEKLTETKDIDELIDIVQNKKEANFALKGYVNLLGNLESTLNAIFNKDIKDRYGAEILYAETQAQAWQHEQKQKFENEVAKIYNLPSWCWDKVIIQYLSEKHTYSELRRQYDEHGAVVKVRNIDRTLTKMDIIQAYIWSKNDVLEKRLINQFGEETLNAMFDEMSLEDVKLAEAMMNLAQSFYPLVNKTFIRKYGLDLPKVSCYFPSTPERGSEVDLYNDYSSKTMNNSFTKARAQSEVQPMDFHNPVATLYNHIDGVAKFVFMSESLDNANLRFKNNDLKRAIINKFGDDVYKTLEQALMNVSYKKEAPVFNGMNKILDNMVGNWIQANVAVKPIVGLKQLLSANNYAVDMPYMTWQKGFLKALSHPKETIDYMMNIPYIKARFEGNFSNEFLKSQIENSAFAMSKKLKDACTLFVKIGDIGAIMFGGKPYIEYLINEKGMSESDAIKQFILSTNRSQQSSAISSLSNFQVNMTRNAMGKLFIAFKNSPQQYIRMCGDAIVSVANGDMTKTQCAKMLFQFGYLQPFFYAVATSGSLLRFLFTGDDDDFFKDAKLSIFNFGTDALPLLGDAYKYALNRIAFKEGYIPQTTPLLGDIENEINRISKKDVTLKDYLEGIGYMTLHVGLGYNSKAIINEFSGAGDILTGESATGLMKVLGYTDKRSKHISGNEKK